MTHRSRNGGPPPTLKGIKGKKPGSRGTKPTGRKLHHPKTVPGHGDDADEHEGDNADGVDSPAVVETEDSPVPPASAFSTPDDADLLAVLRSALAQSLHAPSFMADVQRAKALLYDRQWLELFTDPALLDAYAGRWVPSRAMAFRQLMASLRDVRRVFVGEAAAVRAGEDSGDANEQAEANGTANTASDDAAAPADTAPVQILSIGGGAGSELLAVAALAEAARALGATRRVQWTGVDIGGWGGVLSRIETAARDAWDLAGVEFTFVECDVLDAGAGTGAAGAKSGTEARSDASLPLTPTTPMTSTSASSASLPPTPTTPSTTTTTTNPLAPPAFLTHAPDLTTIFFTLTELLSQSRVRTVALLRALAERTPAGGLLLVTDSASDIAQFPLGKDGRSWPVYMVLDALVLGPAGGGAWEKVASDDSRWWRQEPGVGERWPCKLENARYWMRLYRRVTPKAK